MNDIKKVNHSDNNQPINKQRYFDCKIIRHSIHCGRVRAVQKDESIFYGDETFISLDEMDEFHHETFKEVRLFFTENNPYWLGLLDQDSQLSIRIFLPSSEFEKYYRLLRDEEDVYFHCGFEINADGLTGRMNWFDFTDIPVFGKSKNEPESHPKTKEAISENESSQNINMDFKIEHDKLFEQLKFIVEGNVTTVCTNAINHPNSTSLNFVDNSLKLLDSYLSQAQKLKKEGFPEANDYLVAVITDVTKMKATLCKTLGILNDAEIKDLLKEKEVRNSIWESQKQSANVNFSQINNENTEFKKLL